MIYAVSGRVIPVYKKGKRMTNGKHRRELKGYAYDVCIYRLEYVDTKRPTWRKESVLAFRSTSDPIRPDNRLWCEIQVNRGKLDNTTGYPWVEDLRPGKPVSKRDARVLFPETKDMPEPIVQDYVRDRC